MNAPKSKRRVNALTRLHRQLNGGVIPSYNEKGELVKIPHTQEQIKRISKEIHLLDYYLGGGKKKKKIKE